MIFGKSERRDAAEGRDISERGGFREFLAGGVCLLPGCGGKRGKKLWKAAKSDLPQPEAGGRKKGTAHKKAGAGLRLFLAEGNFLWITPILREQKSGNRKQNRRQKGAPEKEPLLLDANQSIAFVSLLLI